MTHPTRLRRFPWLVTGLTLTALISHSQRAVAQDPGAAPRRPPNVLLIVDTSGSMEYEAGLDSYPSCDPTGVGTNERSRWIDLVEVLTGTIGTYRCQQLDRASSTFTSLYQLPGSLNPLDFDYRNPYHRPLSGTCAPTPNTTAQAALTNAFDFVAPAFSVYNSTTSCTFSQSPDGLIDSFTGNVRFGLMTFDTLPDASNGYDGSFGALYADGIEGAWSYFATAPAAGMPFGCSKPVPDPMEVGARNGAAPAWEGKFIAFGDPSATSSDDIIRHTRIEQVLLSTRPYGATPIAGALTDAQTFLTTDMRTDPTPLSDPLHSTYYGPAQDPYVQSGCRDQYVVLLTDGEPNLDLRPYCEDPSDINGVCPYHRSEDVADEMYSLPQPDSIKTYVVGFADDDAPELGANSCKTMTLDWSDAGICDAPASEELRVCCTLHEIAMQGGTDQAYFGNDKAALRTQLSMVFNEILAGGGSATQPVRSPGVGDAEDAGDVAFRILTSYETGSTGVWRGRIERSRWTCATGSVPTEERKNAALGDDFSYNVNSHPTARTFATYEPTASSGIIYSNRSIRPNIATADATVDSIGKNAGVVRSGAPSTFAGDVSDAALMPDLTSGPCAGLTAANCKTRLLNWFVGINNSTANHRCAVASTDPNEPDCSVIGDVMHSTPVIVDLPSAEIEDETYTTYRFNTAAKDRPMMVYTSSNDGVLHGFKMSPNIASDPDVNNTDSNEVFAFVPPAILSLIDSQYPTSRQKLLDGVPIVQEVVATSDTSNLYYPYKLERSPTSALGATSTFRTILVQAFGGAQSGYFALDITRPQVGVAAADTEGPRMLWQLTTDSSGNPLFGEQGATPLITTLNVSGTEVAVAVLPGGHAATAPGYCPRYDNTHPQINSTYAPRWYVRCYTLDQDNDGTVDGGDATTYSGARSLTIVRLDTGAVLMRFRRNTTGENPALPSNKVKFAGLDSPITGTPAAYPVGPGAVSDRIFVGDQDGTLWRIDTSSDTPSNWTMELFFDTFSEHPDVGTPALAGVAGRPIVVAPTLSVNDFGQVTVATASGTQDLSGSSGEEQYVWSLKETFNSTTNVYNTDVNWYQTLPNGEHVLGPLRLNEGVLYYTTYSPQTGDPCASGLSTIFAVDYDTASLSGVSYGGLPRLSLFNSSITTALPDRATATELGLPPNTIIFGLNLEYAPTCFDSTIPANALLGGNHVSPSNTSGSKLQLAFQTNTTNTSKEPLRFQTGFETIGLNRPSSGATIESWAAILE